MSLIYPLIRIIDLTFVKSIVHYASEVIKIVQFDNILLKQIYRLYFMSQQMNCDTLLTIFVSKLMWFKLW